MWHITSEELSKENKSVIVYFPRKKHYSVMLMKSPPYAWCEFEKFEAKEKA